MNTGSRGLPGAAYGGTRGAASKDLSKVLIGALAGAAVGSLIGGLFTEKGIETRKRVARGSKNVANNLKDKVSDISEGIADKFEAAKEGAADLVKKGKEKVGRLRQGTAYRGTTRGSVKDTGSKVLLGALAASVAGTVIWGLTTEKGTETRKRLGKNSKKIASNLKDKVSNIASGIADTYEAAKDGAADLLERGRQQADMSASGSAYRGTTGADAW